MLTQEQILRIKEMITPSLKLVEDDFNNKNEIPQKNIDDTVESLINQCLQSLFRDEERLLYQQLQSDIRDYIIKAFKDFQ
ncbi:hypothetical protein D0T84_19095 [Dysgonomonas sp. 521]|uniref:hypothetical protein n=1 Tax=Dysgonomonas sp. 521 TaxID=2302932 RepID=UPI0013D325E5|nr:hypothetical protein [Dysgonomonas sp. 521]NDV96997.1 hypothetical protein [Dysgonomonas sp. 521]